MDTRVTVLIERLDILRTIKGAYLTECNYILKITTGKTVQTHRKVDGRLGLEQFDITHRIVTADIINNEILSLDLMK